MRRKFIRQRKKDEEASFVPVLEPVNYPDQLATVKTRYDYFYSLLKVWDEDLMTLIDDEYSGSDKQMTYTISQVGLQLKQLKKMLQGPAKEKVQQGLKEVDGFLSYYEKPKQFRNRDIFRSDVKRFGDSIIKPLKYENIKDDLIKG